MTLNELKSLCLTKLSKNYPREEILSFHYLLIEHVLNLKKTEVFLNPTLEISKIDVIHFTKAINELKENKPIQYIIGNTNFFGLNFKVNNHVLIPRPETEELVAWVIEDLRPDTLDFRYQNSKRKTERKILTSNDQNPTTILDIGTGSGCVAISLAKNLTNATISALDVSKKALEMARLNAKKNNVSIEFIEQDILKFDHFNTGLKYDIIVSNPPYIRQLEKQEIKNNVLHFEPHLALFVENDNPLLFYNKISDFANEHLTKNGKLYFEINQYLASETVKLLEQKGLHTIELREDLFGNKRMLKAIKK